MIRINNDPFSINSIKFSEEKYEEFLNEKLLYIKDVILHYNNINIDIDIIRSPTKHCRQKCRFAIGYDSKDIDSKSNLVCNHNNPKKLVHMLWDQGNPSILVEKFPLASIEIYHIMPILIEFLNNNSILSRSLTSINYTSTLSKELLITLIYNSKLTESWKLEAEKLQIELSNKSINVINAISIIGRSKGLKYIVGRDCLYEELELSYYRRKLKYMIVDDGFVNPNTYVNQKALEWLCTISINIVNSIRTTTTSTTTTQQQMEQSQQSEESQLVLSNTDCTTIDLLEMYCGNGNHTVALSAVEINPSLVTAAIENFKLNNIKNTHAIICDSEIFAMKILTNKQYKLVSNTNNNTSILYQFKVVLVDPPRKGLDSQTCLLITQYEHIIYISCNPESLQRDLLTILKTHKICKMSILDQFAYTPHIETALWLQKIN